MAKKPALLRTALAVPALFAAAALVLTGCSSPAAPAPGGTEPTGDPVRGGTLTVAVNDDPRSLDTVALPGVTAAMISEMVFEQLYAPDKNNEPQPMLVDTLDISDDLLTYNFTLREGIKFHDGTPLTSADVIASLDYWMRTSQPGMLVAASVAGVEANGDLGFTITLSAPRYPLLAELAGPGAIIMKQATAEAGTPQGFLPEESIGTGPYKLAEWVAGQEVKLERYDEYQSRDEDDWGGLAGAKHQYLDSIVYKIVTDEDARVNGLVTDQWQHIMPSDNQYENLLAQPGITVNTMFSGTPNVFVPNFNAASPFSKHEAREALSLLMDRPAIVAASGAHADLVDADGSFASPDNAAMYSTVGQESYDAHDPEKAKELFAQAGVKEGDTLKILTSNSFPQFMQWSVELQQQLKSIGIESEIEAYDFTTTLGMLTQQPDAWDIGTFFFNGALTSPDQVPQLTLNALNGSGSAEMTQLLADYNAVGTPEEARKVIDDLHAQMWVDLPVVPISGSKLWSAYSEKLQGFGDYRRVFWNSWLAE